MLGLAASGQVLADDQLEEVEGGVQAVLVELQLTAQLLDLPLTCTQSSVTPAVHLDTKWQDQHPAGLTILKRLSSGLFANAGMETRTKERSFNWT